MKLYSVTMKGCRRLLDAWMNLDAKVIAIVGPNEAGKSSVLEALALLNDDEPVPAGLLSRGEAFRPNDEVVSARFRLSAAERASAPLPLAEDEGVWLIVSKTVSGRRVFRLDPPATRDRTPRRAALARLESASKTPWFKKLPATVARVAADAAEAESPLDVSGDLLAGLGSDEETLPNETLARLGVLVDYLNEPRVVGAIRTSVGKSGLQRLRGALIRDLETERSAEPGTLAETLRGRVPRFLTFDAENRGLRSSYDLMNPSDLAHPALRNLAATAGLVLEQLRDVSNAGDAGARRSMLEEGQRTLASELSAAWLQAPVTVSFDLQGAILAITVSSDGRAYFALSDRSDGLRTFIALRAFLARLAHEVAPILLVDEAETHLHYDAQADLMRMFEAQDAAAQTIYTTHSVGCLPQDLGRGIRAVLPVTASTRSRVENLWSRDSAGVTPLLRAMGAATVPLAPSRFVVLAEGPSDAMLLPSLLREAIGRDALEYQVVPGLSHASAEDLTRLASEAPRVAFLVDGDVAGSRYESTLRTAGIPPGRLVRLSAPAIGLVLEDLLDPDLYAEAVNRCLASWPPYRSGLPRACLGKTGRPNEVEGWCASQGLEAPGKVRVAEAVLEIVEDRQPRPGMRLSDQSQVGRLRGLHNRLLAALTISSSS